MRFGEWPECLDRVVESGLVVRRVGCGVVDSMQVRSVSSGSTVMTRMCPPPVALATEETSDIDFVVLYA